MRTLNEVTKALAQLENKEWYIKRPKAFINFINIGSFTDQIALTPSIGIIKRWDFEKELENGDLTTYEYEYRLAFIWLNWGISFRIFRKKER